MDLSPNSFIVSNEAFRAFEIDGLLHPVQPISQLVVLSLHNLKANSSETFSLSNEINFALKVSSIRVEPIHPEPSNTLSSIKTVAVNIETLSEDNSLIEKVTFTFQDNALAADTQIITPSKLSNFIIEPDKKYRITPVGTQLNINQLKFFCEPVYILKEINLVFVNNGSGTEPDVLDVATL